jgi:hypothetical protein
MMACRCCDELLAAADREAAIADQLRAAASAV